MSKKILCAVGDSYVFGAELISTYFKDQFSGISEFDMFQLEYNTLADRALHDKYNSLLDSMRFTSLVANHMGMDHINYAQGGASQEGIKFQAQMLVARLKAEGAVLEDTTWIVGVTAPPRQWILTDKLDPHHNYSAAMCSQEYQWSRYTVETLFLDRLDQNHCRLSSPTLKELIANSSETHILTRWAMNICDTANLLRANGVKTILFVNFFNREPSKLVAVTELLEALLRNNQVEIIPSHFRSVIQLLGLSSLEYLCEFHHLNKEGNRILADYIVEKLSNTGISD